MKKKNISVLLLATILLQSCVAYQKTSVPLDVASNNGYVKVTNTIGKSFEFHHIESTDSIYYGVRKGERTKLDEAQLIGIYLQDKKKSTWLTTIGVLSPFIILFTIVIVGLSRLDLNQ